MRHWVKALERRLGRGPRPFEHVSTEELSAALERMRRGEPSGVTILPPDVATGLESLSDEELTRRLEALRTQVTGARRCFGARDQERT